MPQNYLKTASKLLDFLWPPPFWRFWGKKKCLETFGLVETPPPLEKNSYLSHIFYVESFPNLCEVFVWLVLGVELGLTGERVDDVRADDCAVE